MLLSIKGLILSDHSHILLHDLSYIHISLLGMNYGKSVHLVA